MIQHIFKFVYVGRSTQNQFEYAIIAYEKKFWFRSLYSIVSQLSPFSFSEILHLIKFLVYADRPIFATSALYLPAEVVLVGWCLLGWCLLVCCACWDIAASVRLVAICEPIANAAILPLIIFKTHKNLIYLSKAAFTLPKIVLAITPSLSRSRLTHIINSDAGKMSLTLLPVGMTLVKYLSASDPLQKSRPQLTGICLRFLQ